MLRVWQQEIKQLWCHQSLWLAPLAIGVLFLLIAGMMMGSGPYGAENILAFLPILWMFVVLSCVGQGLPLFQEESCFLFYSTLSQSMSALYQRQLLLLSLFLWSGLGALALLSVFLFDFPWFMALVQLLVLALLLPSFLALGHLVKSILPNNGSGSVLLSFLLFPLYIPLLLLSALAVQPGLGSPLCHIVLC
jgi:hypothetical protein